MYDTEDTHRFRLRSCMLIGHPKQLGILSNGHCIARAGLGVDTSDTVQDKVCDLFNVQRASFPAQRQFNDSTSRANDLGRVRGTVRQWKWSHQLCIPAAARSITLKFTSVCIDTIGRRCQHFRSNVDQSSSVILIVSDRLSPPFPENGGKQSIADRLLQPWIHVLRSQPLLCAPLVRSQGVTHSATSDVHQHLDQPVCMYIHMSHPGLGAHLLLHPGDGLGDAEWGLHESLHCLVAALPRQLQQQ